MRVGDSGSQTCDRVESPSPVSPPDEDPPSACSATRLLAVELAGSEDEILVSRIRRRLPPVLQEPMRSECNTTGFVEAAYLGSPNLPRTILGRRESRFQTILPFCARPRSQQLGDCSDLDPSLIRQSDLLSLPATNFASRRCRSPVERDLRIHSSCVRPRQIGILKGVVQVSRIMPNSIPLFSNWNRCLFLGEW